LEAAHEFLTPAQRAYVEHYIKLLMETFEAKVEPGTEREFIIDMDAIADRGLTSQNLLFIIPQKHNRLGTSVIIAASLTTFGGDTDIAPLAVGVATLNRCERRSLDFAGSLIPDSLPRRVL
jgi:hypothetical protein